MTSPDPNLLFDIFKGSQVFDRDTDSKILQGSNEVSGRVLYEFFLKCDSTKPNWAEEFADELIDMSTGDPCALVGFDDGRWQGLEAGDDFTPSDSDPSFEAYLKIEFRNTDACYYQFHLFPTFDEPFIQGASRKRADEFQYIHVTLTDQDDLQVFIQNLRGNPHCVGIHDSNADEFGSAPSHAS